MMHEIVELERWKDTEEKSVYRYPYEGSRWVLIRLKKGTSAGHHYHKGQSVIKNPEVMILISGKLELFFKGIRDNKVEKVIIDAPKMIKVYPFVYHEVKAAEDTIFLEAFSDEAKDDRFEID